MILDLLSSSQRYHGLGARFARAFEWLRTIDPKSLPDGRTAIEGDDLFVLVHRGQTKPLEQIKWEAHRTFADIQYVAESTEAMRWQALERTLPGDYSVEKDFLALEAEAWTEFLVSAGQFAVFFPQDAHRPAIQIPGAAPVVKLVVKVRL